MTFFFSFGSNGLPYVGVTVRGEPKQHKQQAGHIMGMSLTPGAPVWTNARPSSPEAFFCANVQ